RIPTRDGALFAGGDEERGVRWVQFEVSGSVEDVENDPSRRRRSYGAQGRRLNRRPDLVPVPVEDKGKPRAVGIHPPGACRTCIKPPSIDEMGLEAPLGANTRQDFVWMEDRVAFPKARHYAECRKGHATKSPAQIRNVHRLNPPCLS